MFRKFQYTALVSVALLSLTGCETMTDVKNRLASIDLPSFSSDPEIASAEGAVMASAEGCPQVAVVEDLKTLSQFETPATPSPDTNISSLSITGMTANCSKTKNTVAVDIGLRFDGKLGPKAITWNQDSHSFAYPYFVAVTTPSGEILSKEVFAATVRYEDGEQSLTQEETMKQVIPLRDDADAAGYEILIGFQLTDDELNYNREMASQALSAPVSLEAPASEPEPAMAASSTDKTSMTSQSPAVEDMAARQPDVAEEQPLPNNAAIEPSAGNLPASAETVTEAIADAPAESETMVEEPVSAPVIATTPMAPQQQVIRIKADGSVETAN